VRKLCQSRKTSGISASHTTSTTGTPIMIQRESNRGESCGTDARRPTASVTGMTRAYATARIETWH